MTATENDQEPKRGKGSRPDHAEKMRRYWATKDSEYRRAHGRKVRDHDHRTDAERSAGARLGGLTRWAHEQNPRQQAECGQAGLLAMFARKVDPEGALSPAERHKRALRARKAHMLRLSQRSKEARAARRA